MQPIRFATTNTEKMFIAQTVCGREGIAVEQVLLEIDEIQDEDPRVIIKDKAQRAYKQLGKPVVVSDDTWSIPALNGFPGPYMKSINQWFKPEDFLRLMSGIKDRTIILHQYLAYADGKLIKIFHNEVTGKIIHEARGSNLKSPNMTVIAMDWDNGKTIAEIFARGKDSYAERSKDRPEAWQELALWYVSRPASKA